MEITEINKMQTEILGIVAHDLRSPINNIFSLVSLSREENATEEEKNEYYDMILYACKETEGIIHDLMDVARKEDKTNWQMSEVCLNDYLPNIQQQWLHRLQERKQLLLTLPKELIYSNIQPQKMQRVLDNLINNAIKFTKEDGVIELILSVKDKNALISIKDNGIGIPEALQQYMFHRFSRAGRVGLNGEKSYGLGLSIVKQIIENHSGYITVESTVNVGTTFHINLPLMARHK